jgi:hypothetical protein
VIFSTKVDDFVQFFFGVVTSVVKMQCLMCVPFCLAQGLGSFCHSENTSGHGDSGHLAAVQPAPPLRSPEEAVAALLIASSRAWLPGLQLSRLPVDLLFVE